MKSVSRNAFYAMVRAVVQTLFPVIVFAYASRILTPAGIGIINFSNSFVGYFILLAGLGINKYGTREAALVCKDQRKLSKLFVELNVLNLFMTIISLSAYYLYICISGKLEVYHICLFIYGFAIPFSGLAMEWLYYGIEEYAYITKRVIVFRTVGLLLIFLFVRTYEDLWKFAIIQVLSNYGNYVVNFFRLKKLISLKDIKINELCIKKHMIPVLTLFSAQISYTLYSNTDIIMLGIMSGEVSVGVYSIASKLTHILLSCTEMVISVFLPRMVKFYNQRDYRLVLLYRRRIIKGFYMIAFPTILLFWTIGQIIVFVFAGEGYENAYGIACILIVDLLFFAVRIIYETTYLVPMHKERIIAMALILSAITNVFLNYILIPNFQGYGAAIASVISEALIASIYYLYGYYKGEKIRFQREIYLYEVIFCFQVVILVTFKMSGVDVKNWAFIIYIALIVLNILALVIKKDEELQLLLQRVKKMIKK